MLWCFSTRRREGPIEKVFATVQCPFQAFFGEGEEEWKGPGTQKTSCFMHQSSTARRMGGGDCQVGVLHLQWKQSARVNTNRDQKGVEDRPN